jgi:hypothetical protein
VEIKRGRCARPVASLRCSVFWCEPFDSPPDANATDAPIREYRQVDFDFVCVGDKALEIPSFMLAALADLEAERVEATVREFLGIINEHAARATAGMERPGLLQMYRLHPADERMVPSRFQIGDVDNMVKSARSDSNHGHNCYIEGRTVRPDLDKKKRGKLSDTRAVFALTVDSDADKGWLLP